MYSLRETPCSIAGPNWSLALDVDMDFATSVPDTPRPLPVAEEPGRRRSVRSALGLVLSLAVHAALITLAAVPPDAPPVAIMEISLAMGGFSCPGHAAGAPGSGGSENAEPSSGTTQAAVAPAKTTAQKIPVQTESPPAPAPTPRAAAIPKKTAKSAPHPRKPTPPKQERSAPQLAPETALATAPAGPAANATAEATTNVATGSDTAGGTGIAAASGQNGGGDGTGQAGQGGHGDQPFGFGDAGGPGFIHRERPTYPPLAKARKEQGTVVLML
ncbi:MAG: hypothetical protein EOM10_16065, partial [Opitutae bacterium]|nr:hypothetical protein [Opitutae bacterium]